MAEFALPDIYAAIDRIAPTMKVDPKVVKALLASENTADGSLAKRSTLRGDAVSPVGAQGLMQVMPATARGLQQAGILPADWRHDPLNLDSQITAGIGAIKDMQMRVKDINDPFELGAYYNGGTRGLKRYQAGESLAPETSQYLVKMRNAMNEQGTQLTPQQIERSASRSVTAGPSGGGVSRSTSVGSTSYDPAAMQGFLQSAGMVTDQLIPTALQRIAGSAEAVQLMGATFQQAIVDAGATAGAAAMSKAETAAADATRRAGILTAANLNPADANNRAAQALDALDTRSMQLEALRPEIDRRMAVGFFDNPLEFLVNATRLPGMVQQYNSLVQVQQDELQGYKVAKDIAASQISVSEATEADKILEEGRRQAASEASKAQVALSQAQISLQSKAATDALQAVQLGSTAAEWDYKKMLLTRQSQLEREGYTAREAAAKAEADQLTAINLVIKAAGGDGITPERFKQLGTKERDQLMAAGSSKRFGDSLSDSIDFIKYGSLDNMATRGNLATRTWVNSTLQAASDVVREQAVKAQAPGSINKSFNPEKEMRNNVDAIGSQYVAAANVNMIGAKDSNPYKISYPDALKLPGMETNVVASTLKKLGPNGTEPIWDKVDEQQVIKHLVKQAAFSKDPGLSVQKIANDVSQFYQAASKEQARITNYKLFGLATPDKVYAVQMPQLLSGAKTLDLGDRTTVENLITRQVALEIRKANFTLERAADNAGSPFSLVR